MLPELTALLPDSLARCSLGVAAACVVLGGILWLVGARFSRSILALVAVAIGTVIGMHLPAWAGWSIDGMGVAVAGAIVLGTAAFLLHRTFLGAPLAAILMLWGGLGTWLVLRGGEWDVSTIHWNGDLVQLLRDTWQTLPPVMSRAFPAACMTGLSAGITAAVFFPKLSKVLTYSLVGVTMAVVMGAVALRAEGSHRFSALPGSVAAQGAALVGVVLLGAIIQWQITPPRRQAAQKPPAKER